MADTDTKKVFTPNITEQEENQSTYNKNFYGQVQDIQRIMGGQGLFMGFGDEIEAGIKSVFSEKSYNEIVEEVRSEIDAYRKEFPKTAITSEIIGSIVPVVVASVLSGGTATGATAAATTGRVMQAIAKNPVKTGIGQGTLYGAGVAEGNPIERLPSAAISGGVAALAGGAGKLILPTVTPSGRQLINKGANLTPGQAMGKESLGGQALKLGEEVLENIPGVGTKKALERGTLGYNKVVAGEIADIIKFDKSKFKNKNLTDTFVMLDDAVTDFYKKSAGKLKLNKNVKLDSLKDNIRNVVNKSDLTEKEKITALARLQKLFEMKSPTPSVLHTIDKSLSNRVFKGMKSPDPDQREIALVLRQAKELFDDALEQTDDYIIAKDAYGKMRILGGATQGDDFFTPAKLGTAVKKGDASRNKNKLARGEARLQDILKAGRSTVQKELGSSGTAERLLPYLAVGAGTTIDPVIGGGMAGYGALINNARTNALFREALSGAGNLTKASSPFLGSRVGKDIDENTDFSTETFLKNPTASLTPQTNYNSEMADKLEKLSRLNYLNNLLSQ
tara:strand:- start:406 stop:2091 length:1686 start_codon:yes stop_codon:yes gene_type:complete